MNTYSFGFDFGNAETCGVAIVGARKITKSMPTAISHESATRLSNIGTVTMPTHYVFKAKGKTSEYFVGDLALEQGTSIETGYGDPGRYWSSNALMALLTLAASMVDEPEFSINVVTGIPVEAYSGGVENRKAIKKALDGDHEFYINGNLRVVHVKVERVIMEGAGAAIAYGTGLKELQGVIDIGGRTTDLYGSLGQTPVARYCQGDKIGVVTAMNIIHENVLKLYRLPLEHKVLRDIMWAYANKTAMPAINVKGKRVSITSIVEEAMMETEDKIISFIRSKWRTTEGDTAVATDFVSVTVVGGGAHYFFDAIQRDIEHAKMADCPEQANALGYCMFAEQQVRRLRAIA